ncbi:MAG: SseB family protein, partial [Pseudomonadota bacterium]
MTDMTPLDTAHAGMEASPLDEIARLRFFER